MNRLLPAPRPRPRDAASLLPKKSAATIPTPSRSTPAGAARDVPRPAGLRGPARRRRAGDSKADQPQLRRRRPALGHRLRDCIRGPRRWMRTASRSPTSTRCIEDIANAFGAKAKRRTRSPRGARHRAHPQRFRTGRARAQRSSIFADGLNIPSGVQPLPRKAGRERRHRHRLFHPEHLAPGRHRRRRQRRQTRAALRAASASSTRTAMSSNYLYWIDGWIYGTHGFRNHSEVRDRTGKRDRLRLAATPTASAPTAPRFEYLHARPDESLRPRRRSARQFLQRRLPLQACLHAPPRRLLRGHRQAARRPRLRPAHHRRRPRLERHRRHRLLRRRQISRGIPRQSFQRQPRHAPHQSRPTRVARLHAEGHPPCPTS